MRKLLSLDTLFAALLVLSIASMLIAIATSGPPTSRCSTVKIGGAIPLATICQ